MIYSINCDSYKTKRLKIHIHFFKTPFTLTQKKLRKLLQACKKDNILIATDGSAKGERSVLGYCFARCDDGKILFKSHLPVVVDPDYHFSDRAELLAILATASHVKMIFESLPCPPRLDLSFPLYTDSEYSIIRIENKAST